MADKDVVLKKDPISTVSVGVTWVDGRIILKTSNRRSNFYFGICHSGGSTIEYKPAIFACTPLDYEKPLMITTIRVSAPEQFCDRAYSCLHFKCPFNRFDKNVFLSEFGDCREMTLGLPNNLGEEPLWFNEGEWLRFWTKMIIPVDGGILRFNEEGSGLRVMKPYGV